MKIMHIIPNAPYNKYWGYQDNLLPKYHAKLGHEVVVIATNTEHRDQKICEVSETTERLVTGELLIRKKKRFIINNIFTNIFSILDIKDELRTHKPDYIFFHGLVSSTIIRAARYKKNNPKCIIVQDNHLDYNIAYQSKNWIVRQMLRFYYIQLHRFTKHYINKVYGVTPWRKEYAEKEFKVSPHITDVLIMGADDEMVQLSNKHEIRNQIRETHHIEKDDFLIVTGGKIDKKKKIVELMRAVNRIGDKTVKLLIFGNIHESCLESFNNELSSQIIYIGWISANDVYQYFHAADLVAFPGQHSVLWEQACACKVPCIFANWEGMHHVNNGGNSCFFAGLSPDSIKNDLCELIRTPEYDQMKYVAESSATDIYLYSAIAKKSLIVN